VGCVEGLSKYWVDVDLVVVVVDVASWRRMECLVDV